MSTDDGQAIWPLIDQFHSGVEGELIARLQAWPPDFARIHVHEVVGSLLARQARLAKDIAGAPSIWNVHTAPILLRAMADVYINLSWLLLDPDTRCLKFISFGLGQAKLEIEHRRNEMASREPTAEEAAVLDAQEIWIENQRALFLQDVDLGKWSGLSVRQMADEAGCLDFYNYVYTPFSAYSHSMWHFVGVNNLQVCQNPLHRYHRIPTVGVDSLDFHSFILAAKYWSKSLMTFDKAVGFHATAPSAYQALLHGLGGEAPAS